MLTLPQNAEKVQALTPYSGGAGIVFQWMPRQIAPNTKYIFTLKELWDQGQSPISGFLSAPALWTEETYAPTLYYGIDKTQLMPGKRYAWQVQAKSGNPVLGANPTDDNGVYKNNGLSEIFYFDYVENCAVPTLLMAKNVGKGRVELRWSMAGQPAGLYNVQYRKKGSTADWVTQQSYQASAILTGLEDKTEYEYHIGSVCGNTQTFNNNNPFENGNSGGNAYSYSSVQYFTTDADDKDNNYQCGIMPALDIANKNILQTQLGNNEVFTAGDFPVTVLSAQGSGTYTGTGWIEVPYLADTKIKVSFTNIKLNNDKKLIEGVIETTYDPNESAVHYASGGLGETFGDAGVKDIVVDYIVTDIKYTATPPPGKITIYGDFGTGGTPSQQDHPGGKDYQIKDKDGNIWTVDENGNVTKVGKEAEGGASNSTNTEGVTGSGSSAAVNQYTAKGLKIEWKEDANGKFAYDTADKTKLPKSKYPSVKDAESNIIYVPYKATVNKQTELFDAKVSITDPTLKDAKIIFKTLSLGKAIEATELSKTDTERNYQLKLPGTFDYAEEEVIAVLMPKEATGKQKVISNFKLVHLSPQTVNVSLVPLDADSQSKLKAQGDKINQVYNKIGVNFTVKEESVLDISSIVTGNTINSEDSDLMSTYSPQQQQINKLYKGTDARYVLFVTNKNSSTGQNGYMRLNGQFGYVYNNAPQKTGAHELGHGVFKLEHPWKAYQTTKGATELLMDYSTGEELSHLDWKQVNDPAFKLYAFQGQSSGEIGGGFGLTPDFKFVKANTSTVIHGDIVKVGEGFLPGFIENEIQYQWVDSKKAYYPNGDVQKTAYASTATPKNDSSVWLIYDHDAVCGKSKFIKTTFAEVTANILSKADKTQALADYIQQYDKIEDNTKPVYSGFIACSGSGAGGNGLKSINDLYNRPSTGDGTSADESRDVVDYTGRFTADEIQAMLGTIVSNKSTTGIKGKIFITDENTAPAVLQKVQARYNQPEAKEMVIWLNVNSKTKKYDIKINVGSGLPEYAGKSVKDIELMLKQNSAWIDDFWLMKFNPLTAILDGLSELLTKAKIPDRYYNPDVTDYNTFPAKIYSYVSLKVIDDELSGLIGSPLGEKYTPSRVDFAFTCGVWNGLVGTAASIPDGGSFLIKMMTNENDARTKFATTIAKIQWKDVKEMVGEEWNKYTSNPCMVSYGAGEVTFVVASCFIGAGEIKGATAVVQTMDKLDVMGQLLGKTIQIAGKVIKPVVSTSGKAVKYVLKEGVDFIKRIDIKVTPSGLGCGFPIQNIKVTLKNKLANLTEQEAQGIKQKVEQAINNEGGLDKLPVDENGNHLVEIDVDGEKVTAVVGSEDGLNKIKKDGNLGDLIAQLTQKLEARGISKSVADDIILRSMYIDDVIGGNQMTLILDKLVSSSKFKNPEDIIKWLDESIVKSDGIIVNSGEPAKNLINELETGLEALNEGNEVIISKIVGGNEIDVLNLTTKKIIECKRVNTGNYKNVEDRLEDIVKKFTNENKLSTANKQLYPNHEGQLLISNSSNPYFNMDRQQFINALKNKEGLPSNDSFPKIGNGDNQISIDDLKKVHKLTIKNGKGQFVITKEMW